MTEGQLFSQYLKLVAVDTNQCPLCCPVFLHRKPAAPVAFVSGVMGPLLGTDLLHVKDIEDREVGIAGIGGAGTFDGIILSGIVAAYLA